MQQKIDIFLFLSIDRGYSDSDDDEEVDSWHKQRQKMKESLKSKGVKAVALPNKPKPHRLVLLGNKCHTIFINSDMILISVMKEHRVRVVNTTPNTTDTDLSQDTNTF